MPPDPIALGAYVRGYPTDRAAMDRYADLVGRWPALVHIFRNWTDATRHFDPRLADEVASRDQALMVTWQPPAGSIGVIADGGYDDYARDYARAVRAWGGPLLLRFAHEMNGEWIPWRADAAAYRAAWQRLHAIFSEEGAGRIAWVWSPHVRDTRARALGPYYPGDDVVDWLALDGYNWGRSQSGSRWQTFDEVYADSYREVATLAPDKPVMVAEMGCAEEGGDKAAWIRETFLDAVPNRYPAVRAVAWFHDSPRGHADWRVDSSASSLAAWRQVTADPRYGARVPMP
jgi:hypothetical protein